MKKSLVINNLSKVIKNNLILDNINLTFEFGNIYGFSGINGSGKTMLLKCICGLIYPTTGDILLDNKSYLRHGGFLPSCGVIIEYPGFMKNETGFNNLKYLASVNNKISNKDIEETILKVGLDPKDKRKIKKYSLGMKQRLGIAQAIMEDPDILILDEPTNALDEYGVETFNNIVKEFKKRGKLIIIASHDNDCIYSLCDITYKIQNGGIINETFKNK